MGRVNTFLGIGKVNLQFYLCLWYKGLRFIAEEKISVLLWLGYLV